MCSTEKYFPEAIPMIYKSQRTLKKFTINMYAVIF